MSEVLAIDGSPLFAEVVHPNRSVTWVVHGDALDLPVSDQTVDLVITSPPYFRLRSYRDGGVHYDGQIGGEPTPGEYIDALVEATREMIRVIKPTGSIFVNLGDRYDKGGLAMIPERFRIACADRLGVTVRSVVVWHKTNGMPEPVSNRVSRKHEDWVHITLGPDIYCDIEALRQPPAGYSRKGGSAAYTADGSASHGVGSSTLHQMNPLGRLPESVWPIPTEALHIPAHLGVKHFAAFPTEWPRRIISGWAPPGGLVLDPFGGTGTTALVASVLGRDSISVDLSQDYCRVTEWRVSDPRQRQAVATRNSTCPRCQARPGQPCVAATGQPTSWHSARRTP